MKIILAALTALTFATPALAADFTGARIGANVGFADEDFGGTEAFTYGVNAGYDVDLGSLVVGATAEYQDSSEDGVGRDLSAVARLGGKVAPSVLVYGLVGYSNLAVDGTGIELDGIRGGLGLEAAFGTNIYGNVEGRYTNYELGVEIYQMVAGVGFRF